MSDKKTTTSTNCGDYTITFYNIDGFINGNPVVRIDKGLRVPMWFYSIAQILFGRFEIHNVNGWFFSGWSRQEIILKLKVKTMLKKIQVVMLPTNEKAEDCLAVYYNGKMSIAKGLLTKSYLRSAGVKTFHIYFLSDEEIKEGDWYYVPSFRQVQKASVSQSYKKEQEQSGMSKVIATTDRLELSERTADSITVGKQLPQPSQSFLEVFVTEYNKGNQIKEVMVEYEERYYVHGDKHLNTDKPDTVSVLKVNPKDNTITIKKVKDSWSSLEIAGLLRKFENQYHNDKFKLNLSSSDRVAFIGEFIEQNL